MICSVKKSNGYKKGLTFPEASVIHDLHKAQ
jgi:hypothetical protein